MIKACLVAVHSRRRSLVALASMLWLGDVAVAQQIDTIPPSIACRSCRLIIERIGLLGDSSIFFPSDFNDLFSLSGGPTELFAGPLPGGGFGRFDMVGRPIGRSPTYPGRPVELLSLAHLRRGQADSVYVFDDVNRLVSVVDRTFRKGREFRVGGFLDDMLPLPTGRIVVNIVSLDPRTAGYPLFLLSPRGEVVAEFGTTDRSVSSNHTNRVRRRLGSASDGGFWAAHRDRYTIERWSPELVRTRILVREVDWFPVGTRDQTQAPDEGKPGPRIEAVDEDSDGRLWVISSLSDRQWEPTYRRQANSRTERRYPAHASLNSFFDTFIEVIDPNRALLVTSFRSPERLLPVRGNPGVLYSWRRLADGRQVIELWKATIQTR